MSKKHLESPPPEEADKTTPDKQPMSETEMLELMAKTTPFGYPPLATGQRIPIQ